jgi:hypothetical protein
MLVKKHILSIKHVEFYYHGPWSSSTKNYLLKGLGLQYLEFRLMFGFLKQIHPHPACVFLYKCLSHPKNKLCKLFPYVSPIMKMKS